MFFLFSDFIAFEPAYMPNSKLVRKLRLILIYATFLNIFTFNKMMNFTNKIVSKYDKHSRLRRKASMRIRSRKIRSNRKKKVPQINFKSKIERKKMSPSTHLGAIFIEWYFSYAFVVNQMDKTDLEYIKLTTNNECVEWEIKLAS